MHEIEIFANYILSKPSVAGTVYKGRLQYYTMRNVLDLHVSPLSDWVLLLYIGQLNREAIWIYEFL